MSADEFPPVVDEFGPVTVDIRDVAPPMFLRVQGVRYGGEPADVTGFVGWPFADGDRVAVPVLAPGAPVPVLVLVEPGALLVAPPPTWEVAYNAPPLNLGQLDRLELVWEDPAGKLPMIHESHEVTAPAQVEALICQHRTDGRRLAASALYTLNWRGQR